MEDGVLARRQILCVFGVTGSMTSLNPELSRVHDAFRKAERGLGKNLHTAFVGMGQASSCSIMSLRLVSLFGLQKPPGARVGSVTTYPNGPSTSTLSCSFSSASCPQNLCFDGQIRAIPSGTTMIFEQRQSFPKNGGRSSGKEQS